MNAHALTSDEDGACWPSLVATSLALAVVFFATEHRMDISRAEAHAAMQEDMEHWAEGGNTRRQAAYVTLGALGGVLCARGANPLVGRGAMPWLIGLLVLWCFASYLWSVDRGVTLRRLIVFALWTPAVVGIARRYALADLARIVVLSTSGLLALGVFAELALGTFRPHLAEYRFGGTLHPNQQAMNLTLLCLASGALGLLGPRLRTAWLIPLAFSAAFLILTRSRTSLMGLLLASASVWALGTSLRAKAQAALATSWCGALVFFVLVLASSDVDDYLANLALMGREEQTESLTGRLPLWEELLPFASTRPWRGYGYQAFWRPEVIHYISTEMEWPITEAHSSYVESVLGIGLVGTGLVLAIVVMGIARCAARLRTARDPGYGFAFGALLFALLHGLTESAMTMLMWAPFVVHCSLTRLALFDKGEGARQAPFAR